MLVIIAMNRSRQYLSEPIRPLPIISWARLGETYITELLVTVVKETIRFGTDSKLSDI
jgi:hypothetical protein